MALNQQNSALNQLAVQSRISVFESADVAYLSRQLAEQAGMLERLARQYMILEDKTTLDNYVQMREIFKDTQGKLLARFGGAEKGILDHTLTEEVALFELLKGFDKKPDRRSTITEGYRQFVTQTQIVQSTADRLAYSSAEQLQKMAEESQKKQSYFVWASLVIALLLGVLVVSLIVRPIKKIYQAILQLGSADFSKEISVSGPSDLRHLGQRLEWLRSRLQTLETQQTRFLRNMSHELKTPLTAIREGAELLRDGVGGELQPEQREIIHIVRENTLSLQKMIEDLLDYHQSRVMEPDKLLPVDLSESIRQVLREHKLAAWKRLISFETNLLPMLVTGDARKIATIIDNLVSNAVKYSPKLGKINLTLRAERGYARLDVIDEGPGISPDERDKIFESFYQGAPPEEKQRIKGSGLGLAITREYVHAHGGRITVRDRKDGKKGARFIIWLPFWTNTLPLTQPAITENRTSTSKVPIQ
ncbi:MAG: HAMP domain-containing histidine kinase [Burkholderiales bacterium]|nr:HAMP domain-containing histidine kinase [Burkholderiales bacterium]